jgi:glutaryl-CoA dehydrogenase
LAIRCSFDFLHLDSSFSEDELLVRRTARDFVEDNLIPIIEECFREGVSRASWSRIMGELGFFGANLEGYGCAGMSNVEYGLVMQELERGDSGFRSFVSVQSALVMYPIYTFGSDEQKNTWLPPSPAAKSSAASASPSPASAPTPAA